MQAELKFIIDRLYGEIDHANGNLAAQGVGYRIVKSLGVRKVEVSPPAPSLIPGDAVACTDCGTLLPAAGCVACPQCGTTSGGCG